MDTRRIAVFIAGAAAFATLYAPQSLLPVLRPWLGGHAMLAGLVVSAATFGVAVGAPWMGRLGDRLGRRRVIVSAAFAAAVPTLAIASAQSALQMVTARFVEGLTLPGIFAVTVAYITDVWPAQQARSVTGLYVSGTIFGGFSGRLIAGMVAEVAGWRCAFLVLALMQVLFALALWRWLAPDPPKDRAAATRRAPPLLQLLAIPALRGVYVAGFAILFALVGGFTYISLTLAQAPYHLGPAALSAMFTVYIVGGLLAPVSGPVLNALGHTRMLTLAWTVAIGGLLLTLLPELPMIIAGLCLFSAGLFLAQTTATTFVGEAVPAARGAAVGLYVTSYYIGGSIGGVLPAPLWAHAGWPAVVLLIAAAGALSVTAAWRSFGAPDATAALAAEGATR
jgi:predicted MFS family arabinose efflux permease